MRTVCSIEGIHAIEDEIVKSGVSLADLMKRAGSLVGSQAAVFEPEDYVLVMCGPGNNGGDGWVAADYLASRGFKAEVVCAVAPSDIKSEIARMYAVSATTKGLSYHISPTDEEFTELVSGADVIIDAIFGIGFNGEHARHPYSEWIDIVNDTAEAPVISIDVPSGLDATTGLASEHTLVPDQVTTMIALKPGLVDNDGRDVCERVVVGDLVSSEEMNALIAENSIATIVEAEDFIGLLPGLSSAVNKYNRGHVVVVGGSSRYIGAAIIAAKAAEAAGAGYVTLVVPTPLADIARAHTMSIPVVAVPMGPDGTFAPSCVPQILDVCEHAQAVVVGPGMGTSAGTRTVLEHLLDTDAPLVLDADALNTMARMSGSDITKRPRLLRREAPLVLTPHNGELARLIPTGSDEPINCMGRAVAAAKEICWAAGSTNICVLAKGSQSAVVTVGDALLPTAGPAAMAKAGSGDVLAGMVGSVMAQYGNAGLETSTLVTIASQAHGLAGALTVKDGGTHGFNIDGLIAHVGRAMDDMESLGYQFDLDEKEPESVS